MSATHVPNQVVSSRDLLDLVPGFVVLLSTCSATAKFNCAGQHVYTMACMSLAWQATGTRSGSMHPAVLADVLLCLRACAITVHDIRVRTSSLLPG